MLLLLQHVLGWLKQQVPQGEQAALQGWLRRVVADRLLQQLLLAWLAPAGERGADGDDGVTVTTAAAAASGDGGEAVEPMQVDGPQEQLREQQGAAPPPSTQQQQQQQQQQQRRRQQLVQGCQPRCEDFVCCRDKGSGWTAPACGAGAADAGAAAASYCRFDHDLEEAGCLPSTKPPLRVSELGAACSAGSAFLHPWND